LDGEVFEANTDIGSWTSCEGVGERDLFGQQGPDLNEV